MASVTSDTIVKIKENIDDIVYRLQREETTFLSSIKKEKVHNTVYTWLEKSLAAPTKVVATEGATFTDGTPVQPTVRTNYTQIFADTVNVSMTSDVVSKYGRGKETTFMALDAALQLRIAQEHSCVGTKQAGTNASLAREFASVQAMIDTANLVKTGGVSTPVSETTHLIPALQKVVVAGGAPKVIMVNPTEAVNFASFAGSSGRTRDLGNDTTIVNAVDLYASPFYRKSKVVLNYRLADGDSIIYNPDLWKNCELRAWKQEELAKTADGTRIAVVGEYGLKHTNFLGGAILRRAV